MVSRVQDVISRRIVVGLQQVAGLRSEAVAYPTDDGQRVTGGRLVADSERQILDRIPVAGTKFPQFEAQSIGGGSGQPVHVFQSEPIVRSRSSEALLVIRPRKVPAGCQIDSLLDNNPTVDGQCWICAAADRRCVRYNDRHHHTHSSGVTSTIRNQQIRYYIVSLQ
jgi:hypothetical protein